MPGISMLLNVVSGGLAVIVFVWGLYTSLTGRFRFPGGVPLEGRRARTIGILLIVSSLLAYLIPALFLRRYVANYQPVPALAVLLLLAAGWFLTFRTIVVVAKLSRGKASLVGSIIAILFVAFHLWVVVETPRTGVNPSIAQALAPVCSGQGVQEAAEYTGGSGPHTTVVLDSSGRLYESVRGFGSGWNPGSVADTELVLCVREETTESPLCPDGSRLDNVAGRYADLFEARTGRLIQRFDELTTSFKCPTEHEWSEDLTTLSGLGSVLEDYLYITEGD